MKNVIATTLCCVALAACADKPANDASTTTSTTTTASTGNAANTSSTLTNSAASDSMGAPKASTDATASRSTSNGPTGSNAATTANGSSVVNAASGSANDVQVVRNPGSADGTAAATNTKTNDRDRHGALTPMDQGGGSDMDITAAIRKAVVGDSSLSFNAKNVKIITVGGKVTLRGPVKTDAERIAIEAKAKATTGVSQVDNQLEVKK